MPVQFHLDGPGKMEDVGRLCRDDSDATPIPIRYAWKVGQPHHERTQFLVDVAVDSTGMAGQTINAGPTTSTTTSTTTSASR